MNSEYFQFPLPMDERNKFLTEIREYNNRRFNEITSVNDWQVTLAKKYFGKRWQICFGGEVSPHAKTTMEQYENQLRFIAIRKERRKQIQIKP